jgi:hypothetical protein
MVQARHPHWIIVEVGWTCPFDLGQEGYGKLHGSISVSRRACRFFSRSIVTQAENKNFGLSLTETYWMMVRVLHSFYALLDEGRPTSLGM